MVDKFVEVSGLLGTLGLKLLSYNYLYTVTEGIVFVLSKLRRAKRVFLSHIQRCSRNLKWGRYRHLDMFGMGLKYEWWLYNLRMTIGYTHHVFLEVEGGYILVVDDKIIALFSGHIEYLNIIYAYITGVNPMGKYKEKGIIDPVIPPRLLKRKEKRR